jgi:hypothetical protein
MVMSEVIAGAVGFAVGSVFGVVCACLCVAASRDDYGRL